MDPLRGDVFSPADRGTYLPRNRYCKQCMRGMRETAFARFALGLLVGYVIAVAVWQAAGAPC